MKVWDSGMRVGDNLWYMVAINAVPLWLSQKHYVLQTIEIQWKGIQKALRAAERDIHKLYRFPTQRR